MGIMCHVERSEVKVWSKTSKCRPRCWAASLEKIIKITSAKQKKPKEVYMYFFMVMMDCVTPVWTSPISKVCHFSCHAPFIHTRGQQFPNITNKYVWMQPSFILFIPIFKSSPGYLICLHRFIFQLIKLPWVIWKHFVQCKSAGRPLEGSVKPSSKPTTPPTQQ